MLGIDEGKPSSAGERWPALIDEEYLEDVSGEHRMHRNAARKAASLSTTTEHRNTVSRSSQLPLPPVLTTTTFRNAYLCAKLVESKF